MMELCNRHRHLLEMLTAERNRYGRARKSLRQEIAAPGNHCAYQLA